MSRREYVNLNGQFIPKSEGYYNLATNRYVTSTNSRTGFIVSEKYKIIGSLNQIERFADLNNIPLDNIITFSRPGFFSRLRSSFTCFSRAPQRHVIRNNTLKSSNIDKIDFNNICEFNLLGLKGTCRIIEIIDGDTFIVGIILPLDYLRENHPRRISNLVVSQAVSHVSDENVKIAIKIRCRFSRIDAVEMKSADGPRAKAIFEDISKNYADKFSFICLGFDKYGRFLLRLFLPSGEDLESHLVKNYPTMFKYYYGGKKEEWI